MTHQHLAEKYCVSRSQITGINRRDKQEAIVARCTAGHRDILRGCRATSPMHPGIENELIDWFLATRSKKRIVTTGVLRDKALQIRDYRITQEDDENEYKRLCSFACSNRWIGDFKERNNITLRSVTGTEDTIQAHLVSAARDKLKQVLVAYPSCDIYNADETGLFYRKLPGRSLVLRGISCKEQAQSKDRITLLLCCSASGEKLKPLVIGKSARPRALKSYTPGGLPCIYRSNSNAWLTRQIFEEWLQEVNETMLSAHRHICLILDNFSGHVLRREFSNVHCVFITPGMTSVLQPLDSGIIHSFKAHYKALLVSHHLKEDRVETSAKFNIREAIEFASSGWEAVSRNTIINCWRHADIIHQPDVFLLANMVE
jgi:DDE superfamily endonuclease/Tc5 transposase DNA-binding domain